MNIFVDIVKCTQLDNHPRIRLFYKGKGDLTNEENNQETPPRMGCVQ
jgi:hypothetical protein